MRTQLSNDPDTFKHYLLTRLGYIYVAPYQLQVICQDGRFHGYLSQGYHRVHHWNTTYPNVVNIGVRKFRHSMSHLRTADGGTADAEVVVKYIFDPRTISSREVEGNLAQLPNHIIQAIIEDELDNALRQVVGEYPAHTLHHGSLRPTLQRKCKQYLTALVSQMGFNVLAVSLKQLSPPATIEKQTQAALGQIMAADYLQHLPQEQLIQLLIAKLPEILAGSDVKLNMLTPELGLSNKIVQGHSTPKHQTGQHEKPMRDSYVANKTRH